MILNVHASRLAIRLHFKLYSGTHFIVSDVPSPRWMTEGPPQADARFFDVHHCPANHVRYRLAGEKSF
jgi:hypothetical protein